MKYRFVDKIIDLDPGKSIHTQRVWPEDLEIFQDHFPEFSIVPGALLTESMGQSAELCIESKYPEYGAGVLFQIKNAIFRHWVVPGITLDIKVDVLSAQPKLGRVRARTEHEGKLVARAELLCSFKSKEKLGLPEVDPVLAAYLEEKSD